MIIGEARNIGGRKTPRREHDEARRGDSGGCVAVDPRGAARGWRAGGRRHLPRLTLPDERGDRGAKRHVTPQVESISDVFGVAQDLGLGGVFF